VVVAYSEVLSWYSTGWSEENNVRSQGVKLILLSRFKPDTLPEQITCCNDTRTCSVLWL